MLCVSSSLGTIGVDDTIPPGHVLNPQFRHNVFLIPLSTFTIILQHYVQVQYTLSAGVCQALRNGGQGEPDSFQLGYSVQLLSLDLQHEGCLVMISDSECFTHARLHPHLSAMVLLGHARQNTVIEVYAATWAPASVSG